MISSYQSFNPLIVYSTVFILYDLVHVKYIFQILHFHIQDFCMTIFQVFLLLPFTFCVTNKCLNYFKLLPILLFLILGVMSYPMFLSSISHDYGLNILSTVNFFKFIYLFLERLRERAGEG